MTQALYAHMNNKKIIIISKKKDFGLKSLEIILHVIIESTLYC
jgi:hypothetical protein